jgi:hypothetical protein
MNDIVYIDDAHPSHKKLNISYKDQNITLFLLLGKHGYASDFSNENLLYTVPRVWEHLHIHTKLGNEQLTCQDF